MKTFILRKAVEGSNGVEIKLSLDAVKNLKT